jgi:hypothetical protein
MGLRSALFGALGVSAAVSTPIGASVTVAPPRPNVVSGAATRVSSGIVDDIDQNTEVRGSRWYGTPGRIGIAGKMLRDPYVGQSVESIIAALISGNWTFRPASDDPLDREVAAFCNWAFLDCLPWGQTLRSWALGYISNGFHLSEMTDAVAPVPGNRFKLHPGGGFGIVPTGFHEIPAWSVYRWLQSPKNPRQIAGIEQYLQGADEEAAGLRTISADRIFRISYDQEGADYEGFALMRRQFQPWKMKMAFLTYAAIKHERMGVPVPTAIAAADADEADIAAAELTLAEMRNNEKGFVVLKNGWTFKWEGASGSDGTNLEQAIATCNIAIAHAMAGGFMLLGLNNQAGSFALGGTQQGQHHLQSLGHAKFLASVFTNGLDGWSPLRRVVSLNYGEGVSLPRLEARNLPTRNYLDVAKAIINAAQAKAIRMDAPTEERIREMLELDPYDPSTAIEAPKPESLALLDEGTGEGAPDDEEETEPEPEQQQGKEAAA